MGFDSPRAALETVLVQWHENLGSGTYTVQQVIERAINVPTFYTALMTVAATKSGTVSNERLGRWLKRVQGKIVDGLSLTQRGRVQGYPLWTLKG